MRGLIRLLALIVLSAGGHLLLLWLWNPKEAVPPPLQVSLAPAKQGQDITLLFGGDTALTDAAMPTLKRNGYEYPLAPTLHLLRQANLAVLNLEAPVTTRHTPFPLYKRYVYRMDPAGLQALKWAGVDLVSLANNHLMDHGREGLRATLENLDRAGVAGVGGGLSGPAARRGVVVKLGDTRVGLLSYMEDSFMHSLYVRSFAWGSWPGCARMEAANIKQDIARLRREADLVVVLAHWGRYYTGVTMLQRYYGELIIDSGADAVMGHHPHIHHPVGLHRGKPIVYSLGNYAFGTPGRESFKYGLMARLVVRDKKIRRLEVIPLMTQNREIGFKPEPLVGKEATQMLAGLAAESREFGAEMRVVEGVGVVDLKTPSGPR